MLDSLKTRPFAGPADFKKTIEMHGSVDRILVSNL